MQFNFGQVFSDNYNRALDRNQARDISNTELQLRAKQVEDSLLTNAVQREQIKAAIALAKDTYALEKGRTESLNTYQDRLGRESEARTGALNPDVLIQEDDPVARFNPSMAGKYVTPAEYASLLTSTSNATTAGNQNKALDDINNAVDAIQSVQQQELTDALSAGYEAVSARQFWDSSPVIQQRYGTYENLLAMAQRQGASRNNPEYEALKAKQEGRAFNVWDDYINPFGKAKKSAEKGKLKMLSNNPVIYPTKLLTASEINKAKQLNTIQGSIANPAARDAFSGNAQQISGFNPLLDVITNRAYTKNQFYGTGASLFDNLNNSSQAGNNE